MRKRIFIPRLRSLAGTSIKDLQAQVDRQRERRIAMAKAMLIYSPQMEPDWELELPPIKLQWEPRGNLGGRG